MKNKIKKIILIPILVFMVILNINFAKAENSNNTKNTQLATAETNRYYHPNRRYYDPTSSATDPELIENISPIIDTGRDNPIVAVSRTVLSILQLIGVALGLIMLVIIGIRFIVSKDKPDIKETAINYIFGACCIFGATGILSVIQQLVNEFNSLV